MVRSIGNFFHHNFYTPYTYQLIYSMTTYLPISTAVDEIIWSVSAPDWVSTVADTDPRVSADQGAGSVRVRQV